MSIVVDSSDFELLEKGSRILARGMSAVCRSLCCLCFDTGTYINYGTAAGSSDVTQGTLEELRAPFAVIAEKSALSDRDEVKAFFDLDTLKQRLTSDRIVSLAYRDFDGSWTSAGFVVTDRMPDGGPKNALYISEASNARRHEDAIDAIADRSHLTDSLTGLPNRAGYDRMRERAAHSIEPVAYVLIDVDHLKEVNDRYGHAVGDGVLRRVADVLRSIIRKGDDVARVGDDEFAVFLNGCSISAYQQVVDKFESAHRMLFKALPDDKPVTLSVGICFSPAGVDDSVTKRADDSMYVAKGDGRGGCVLSDENGIVFKKWFDQAVDRRHDIVFINTVGSWRIEVPADGSPRRMFCDDAMLRIAGEKRRYKPEEVYERWRSGLPNADADNIDSTLEALSSSKELVHTTFTWESEAGNSFPIVSSIARDRAFVDGACYYGYFDLTHTADSRKRGSELEMLNEALARSLVFGYVLDLESGTYATLRQPASGPLAFIKPSGPVVSLRSAFRRFIADSEGEDALNAMLDRETMPSRLAGIDHVYCDFLSTGVQGWCRAKLYTFKAGGFDGLEKVVLVGESIELDEPGRYEAAPIRPMKRGARNSGRVLVVDDEELNRVILADALEDEYEVVCAADGAEAYEIISQRPGGFVGVVADIMMPNMNGDELLQKLQEEGFTDEVPVMILTAESETDAEDRCLKNGAIDFMRKPFHPSIARKRVDNVVELFKYQSNLRGEVERRTEQLQSAYDKLEEKSMWLREYAFRLSESSARMIESLSEIVEFRSVETGTHVARVKSYTNALARHLMETDPDCGLTEETVKLITDASPLHDVGKIAIPDNVLLKPGKLTEEEFEVMKTHTTEGYRLLSSLDSSWEDDYRAACEEICLCHHERYDGSGYPNGLKGEEIPLSAQIVSIADVFDALTSDRVYRPALSHEKTYELLMSGKLGSFSPRMLKCFDETFPQFEGIAKSIG